MKYLTTAEVAAIIGETPENVTRRCAKGQIRATKLGNQWRISEADLADFMRPNNTVPSPRQRLGLSKRQQRERSRRAS